MTSLPAHIRALERIQQVCDEEHVSLLVSRDKRGMEIIDTPNGLALPVKWFVDKAIKERIERKEMVR